MLSWTVTHAQTTAVAPPRGPERTGLAATATAAWLAAADATIELLAATADDTRPLLLRVDPANDDAEDQQTPTAACSLMVVSAERDAQNVLDLETTRATIHDHVAALLGAAALTEALGSSPGR